MSRLIVKPRRRKKSRPLRPTTTSVTSGALDCRMKSSARRTMFELNAPASPRSAVMITTWRRGPARWTRSGCGASSWAPALDTRFPSSSAIFPAYGRAARIRSCARRSFAAATSFIARVIFCVDSTDRIRRRMSRRVAMRAGPLRGLDALGGHELRLRVVHGLREALAQRVRDLLLVADLGEDPGTLALEPTVEVRLEVRDRVHRQVVEQSLGPREDDGNLLLDGHRPVLALLQDLDHALAARELHLGRPVEVAAELREGRQLTILSEVEPQLAGHLAHRLDLRRAAHPRDRQADVDRGPDAAVEEVRLEVDLPVGDGDDVRRDVRGHVAELGLDDRQRGQRASAERVVELRRALEQARVQVEHVPRIRLAPGRPPEQQRELPVRRGVLGEVVVDAERVALPVPEVLPHRDARVRRDVLEGGRLGRRGHDDRRVLHGARVFENLDHLRHGRALLPDRDVEAVHVLALLVEDRVHADRGLAGPAVADDQLALAAPDRDHRVDGLEPGLERVLHRPAVHDARGVPLDRPELLGVDRALAVHRLAERVDDAARQGLADRHLGDPVRALDDVAFLDELVVAEEHRADLVLLEVKDHPDDVAGELEQLTRHRLLEPVDAGDAVADLDDAPDLLQVDLGLVACQLSLENLADLSGLDHPCPLTSRSRSRASWPSRLPSTRRLPISATNPPRSAWSTASSSITCLPPSTRLKRPASASRSPSASGVAVRTRARTRPAAASTSSRYAAAMPGRRSTRPCAATSARKSRVRGTTSSRAATSAAALRLTVAVTHGRLRTARSSGSRTTKSATTSSSRATTSAWPRSCASATNAFA